MSNASDLENFVISYGFPDNYICYDIDELIGGFKPYGENNDVYSYRLFNADGSTKNIPIEHGVQLIDFLDSIKDSHEETSKILELLSVLKDIKREINARSDIELLLIDYFSNLSNESKEIFKEYLIQLFNIGMYMRRWDGPGTPYPLNSNSTRGQFNKEERVTPELNNLADIGDRLPEDDKLFIESLKMVQHFDGISRMSSSTDSTIERLVDKTIRGNFCIRQASTFFIGSGAYYAKIFFGYEFDNYDINLLAQIS